MTSMLPFTYKARLAMIPYPYLFPNTSTGKNLFDLKKVLSAGGAEVFMGLLLLGEIARLSGLTPH